MKSKNVSKLFQVKVYTTVCKHNFIWVPQAKSDFEEMTKNNFIGYKLIRADHTSYTIRALQKDISNLYFQFISSYLSAHSALSECIISENSW